MPRLAAVAAAMLAAAAIAAAGCGDDGTASFGRDARDLLPDLVTGPIRDLYVESRGGTRRLRLTHEIDNIGRGPFELHPRRRPCGVQNARGTYGGEQWIFRDADGNGRFDRATDTERASRVVTCLIFHAVHGHWHIDDFVRYEVLAYDRDGRLVRTPVRTSGKVSFCLVDGLHPRPELPGSPPGSYFAVADALPGDCEEGTLIGLSVGYGDIYRASLADQWVDVTGLAPGEYCLQARTDVRHVVPEVREDNNDGRTRIRLRRGGRTVEQLSGGCG
jgi:hypothetical protein